MPASEHPFPLPNFSRTEPHLALKFHTGMHNELEKVVSNREEIRPGTNPKARRLWTPASGNFGEWPLVVFTLFGQMAAGIAVLSFLSGPLSTPILITLGFLLGLAGLGSLLHLGSPMNAWRSIVHLRKSWLSREILMFGLFGASWLLSLALPGMGKLPLAACGIGLVYSMSQVYRLRSIPAWDSNRTLMAFTVSAILLGAFGLKAIGFLINAGIEFPPFVLIATAGLGSALWVEVTEPEPVHQAARRLRLVLIGLGLTGVLATYIVPNTVGRWIVITLFMIVLLEEALGRWLFYQHLQLRNL